MAAGDIYYLSIAFEQKDGAKMRYTVEIGQVQLGLILLESITSQYAKKSDFIKAQYYPIKDWCDAGLKKPSYIDIGSRHLLKLQEMIQNSQYTGQLSLQDLEDLALFIKSYKERLQKLKRK
ncbi:MAG: hypothetical protein LBI13_06440 [Streptococcaceae bacterium]|jgi:hypothetical protein|nr:hypothetical protein [Streptococcaceae bacterium]